MPHTKRQKKCQSTAQTMPRSSKKRLGVDDVIKDDVISTPMPVPAPEKVPDLILAPVQETTIGIGYASKTRLVNEEEDSAYSAGDENEVVDREATKRAIITAAIKRDFAEYLKTKYPKDLETQIMTAMKVFLAKTDIVLSILEGFYLTIPIKHQLACFVLWEGMKQGIHLVHTFGCIILFR